MILSDFLLQVTVHNLVKRRTHEGTMAELRWIQTSLIVTLLLQVPDVTGLVSSLIFRRGEDATLPCGNMRDRHGKCGRTTWSFNSSSRSVELISRGQIGSGAQDQSDRLSLTENCGLVLKNVSHYDVGQYGCSQVATPGRQGSESLVDLSLLNMSEGKNGDKVELYCKVASPGECRMVEWKYKGPYTGSHIRGGAVPCNATVTFSSVDLHLKSKYKEFFKCQVKNSKTGEVQVFPFPDVTGQDSSLISRLGDDATLSCGNIRDRQGKCDGTTWSFSSGSRSVELISQGQIGSGAQGRSDGLSLTENCGLVLKDVSYDDVGLYSCSQVDTSGRQVSNALVYLSLFDMSEKQNGDVVQLYCGVATYRGRRCGYSVMGQFEGLQAGNTKPDIRMYSSDPCSIHATFNSSDPHLKSNYKEFIKCEVKNSETGEVQVFSFPEASDVTGKDSSLISRLGDDATLPCGNIRYHQGKCDATTWSFSSGSRSVELISRGQVGSGAQDQSDRLSLTENCGLVLKDVSLYDAGLYSCSHVETSGRQVSNALVVLFLLHMSEKQNGDEVKLHCSVSEHGGCRIVEWRYDGPQAGNTKRIKMSAVPCSTTVTFNSSDVLLKSKYKEFFKCEVENTKTGEVQLFPFPEASVDPKSEGATAGPAAPGGSALTFIMLLMRVAELLLLTVITVLLIRAAVKQRAAERSPAGRRSGAAATQVQRVEEEDEGPVDYENSVRLH